MKSPAYIFVTLLLAVVFSLVAYRVSVHYAQVPGAGTEPAANAPAAAAPAAPAAPALPEAQQQAADAIARGGEIRAAVQAYFEANGAWPRSLAQLSRGNPDQYADAAIAAISIESQGVVAIAMKPHVARGGTIRLIPQSRPDGTVTWDCRATNYPAATRLPDCR